MNNSMGNISLLGISKKSLKNTNYTLTQLKQPEYPRKDKGLKKRKGLLN